jgi:hypothetical protein
VRQHGRFEGGQEFRVRRVAGNEDGGVVEEAFIERT